jgi:5-methylthioribose kinase
MAEERASTTIRADRLLFERIERHRRKLGLSKNSAIIGLLDEALRARGE